LSCKSERPRRPRPPLALAQAGTPDPGWDFEPDQLTIKQGTVLSVVNEGGEPHTFTEVKQYRGGFFLTALSPMITGRKTRKI
jgi:plastocyanin